LFTAKLGMELCNCCKCYLSGSQVNEKTDFLGPAVPLSPLKTVGPIKPDTSLYCRTADTGLVHCVICLLTFQPKLILVLPTPEGWKAESIYSRLIT